MDRSRRRIEEGCLRRTGWRSMSRAQLQHFQQARVLYLQPRQFPSHSHRNLGHAHTICSPRPWTLSEYEYQAASLGEMRLDSAQTSCMTRGQQCSTAAVGWPCAPVSYRQTQDDLGRLRLTRSDLAPGRIRPRDPLLRRHIRTVAGRRPASPYEPSNSSYCR